LTPDEGINNFMIRLIYSHKEHLDLIRYNCCLLGYNLSILLRQSPEMFFAFVDKEKAFHPLYRSMFYESYEETLIQLDSFRRLQKPQINITLNLKSKPVNKKAYFPEELYFISYKSENVLIARRVAEILTQSGYNVWFNEYQILLGVALLLNYSNQ
jgi:hypothetical protein